MEDQKGIHFETKEATQLKLSNFICARCKTSTAHNMVNMDGETYNKF